MPARTLLDYGCLLFRLKTLKPKTPHPCLSQPHGGYCLQEENGNDDTAEKMLVGFLRLDVSDEWP